MNPVLDRNSLKSCTRKGGDAPRAGPGQGRKTRGQLWRGELNSDLFFCRPLPPVNIRVFSQYRERLQRSPWQPLPLTPGHLIGNEKGGQAMFSQICESYALVCMCVFVSVPVPGVSWHIPPRFYVFFKLLWRSCVPLG